MWVELDKTRCFDYIANGVIDLNTEQVLVVGFQDEGWVEPLGIVDIEAIRFLVESEDIKIFHKVVDKQQKV